MTAVPGGNRWYYDVLLPLTLKQVILKIKAQKSGFWYNFTFYLQDHRLITGIHPDSD
jgi:hypothetical protein